MFQIPLKIGKNNDIIDICSDFGGGNTDRGIPSQRSYDEYSNTFEDRLLGNSYTIIKNNTNGEITARDDYEQEEHIQFEQTLETQTFQIALVNNTNNNITINDPQQLLKLTLSQEESESERMRVVQDSIHLSDLQESGNNKDDDDDCRDIYSNYLMNKFNKNKNGEQEMLLDKINQRKRRVKNDYYADKENYQEQQPIAKKKNTKQIVPIANDDDDEQLLRNQNIQAIPSCNDLKDKLKDILSAIRSVKMNTPLQELLQQQQQYDNDDQQHSQQDFESLFAKIKENVICLQKQAESKDEAILQDQALISQLREENKLFQEQVTAKTDETGRLREKNEEMKVEYDQLIQDIKTDIEQEKMKMRRERDEDLQVNEGRNKAAIDEKDKEIERLKVINAQLVGRVREGKAMYGRLEGRYREERRKQEEARKAVGELIVSVAGLNKKFE